MDEKGEASRRFRDDWEAYKRTPTYWTSVSAARRQARLIAVGQRLMVLRTRYPHTRLLAWVDRAVAHGRSL